MPHVDASEAQVSPSWAVMVRLHAVVRYGIRDHKVKTADMRGPRRYFVFVNDAIVFRIHDAHREVRVKADERMSSHFHIYYIASPATR